MGWSDYTGSLEEFARIAVLEDMTREDHVLQKLLLEIPSEMGKRLYNTHLSPTLQQLKAAFQAHEQEQDNRPKKEKNH